MKKITAVIAIFFLLAICRLYVQQAVLKGNISDTAAKQNLQHALITIQDSLRNLNWEITNDTRTIAGLEYRKATSIMMDSVSVVAFFTEQIPGTSGPEGFNGLPGMIPGIAIRRLHTTWCAIKLELIEVKDTDIAALKKGKISMDSQLKEQLKPLIKDAGSRGHRTMWQITI